MEEKDISLLRPFDLEAAQRGEKLTCSTDYSNYTFLGEGDKQIAVKTDSGKLYICSQQSVRMKPLCWVEGKPLYKGDVLYSTLYGLQGARRTVVGISERGNLTTTECGEHTCCPEDLTWKAPKVKREGWVVLDLYKENDPHKLHPDGVKAWPCLYYSEEEAKQTGAQCCVRVEWEEDAK